MTRLRQQKLLPVALAVLALAAALALVVWSRQRLPGVHVLAAQRLQDAAEGRPVSRTERLIWDYQARVQQVPQDTNAYATLGAAYMQRARETGDPGYYAKAQQAFDQALRRDPQHVEALIGKGTLALGRHQFREALALGEEARALNPSLARAYGVIGDALVELGQYEAALETIQTMVDLRPDLASYSRVAYMRELHGDLEGAIEAMQAAADAGGPSAENGAWARAQLGNLYFAQGDLQQAEEQYRWALARLPDYVYGSAGLARVRAAQGHTREAIKLYEQAIERVPLPEFVIALGELHEADGRSAEAQQLYQLVRAMQQLFAANGVDTDLELALFDADHGDQPATTVALAQAAYERHPSIKAADTLAWALFKAGRAAEARRYADEALRLGTRDALMHSHAGMIAQALGDEQAARNYLQQALGLNPHSSPLHAARARLALAAGVAK
jgi:tetratricopeptide (TPR) repeat protein